MASKKSEKNKDAIMLLMTRPKRPILKANGETLGQRLRRLRKVRGLTQTELGELVGVSMRAMCSYERDECEPCADLIVSLAEHLGVSLDTLMGVKIFKSQSMPTMERRLLRRFNEIKKLSKRKKQTLIQLLDMALQSSTSH